MVKLFRSTYGWSKEFTDMNGFDYTNNYNARMQYAVLQTALVRQGLKLYMNNTERWIKWQADIESLLAEDFDMILLFLYTGLGLIGGIFVFISAILLHRKARENLRLREVNLQLESLNNREEV